MKTEDMLEQPFVNFDNDFAPAQPIKKDDHKTHWYSLVVVALLVFVPYILYLITSGLHHYLMNKEIIPRMEYHFFMISIFVSIAAIFFMAIALYIVYNFMIYPLAVELRNKIEEK